MRISAIILSFNSEAHIERCLLSLIAGLNGTAEPDEIWVIDNGSIDRTPTILRRFEEDFPRVMRVIYHTYNLGTTISRNLALRRATGRYLMVMDSDVIELPRKTIDTLIEFLGMDRTCGIAVPRLIYPDGRFQLSTDVFPTIPRKLQRFFRLRAIEAVVGQTTPPSEIGSVDYAISALWLLRRDVLERVGVFDERIFYSPEDVDYCLRVWKAGLRVVYVPSVHAVHDAREISRGFKRPRFTVSHAQGLLYLFAKHRYGLSRKRLYRRIGRYEHE